MEMEMTRVLDSFSWLHMMYYLTCIMSLFVMVVVGGYLYNKFTTAGYEDKCPTLFNPVTAVLYAMAIGFILLALVCSQIKSRGEEYCIRAIEHNKRLDYVQVMKDIEHNPRLEMIFGRYSKIVDGCKDGDVMAVVSGGE